MAQYHPVVVREALAAPAQHLLTEVEPDPGRARTRRQHQRERDAVAGTEIEHALDLRREQLAELLERVDAVRKRFPLAQVRDRVRFVHPEIGGHLTDQPTARAP